MIKNSSLISDSAVARHNNRKTLQRPIFCINSTIPVLFPSFLPSKLPFWRKNHLPLSICNSPRRTPPSLRPSLRPSVRRFVLQLQLSFLRRSPAKLQSLQRRRRQNTSHSRSCLPKPPPSLPRSLPLLISPHPFRDLGCPQYLPLKHTHCTGLTQ